MTLATSRPLDRLALSAFAAAVQLAQHFALRDDPTLVGPLIDGQTFHLAALRAVQGGPAPTGLHWQSPWFVWALGWTYRVVGATPARGLVLTSLFAVACVALVHRLAEQLGLGRRAAIGAGVCAALYGPLLFFSSQLIAAPLDAAAALLALLAAIAAPAQAPLRAHALAGLALGFAAAQRGTVWPFGLFALASLWRARGAIGPRTAARRAAVYALGAALASLPVAIDNLRRAGRFTTLTTNAGINLWIGNNPDIARTTAVRPGCGWDWLTLEPVRHGVFSSSGRSEWFGDEAIRWALTHPLSALGATLKKLSDTFNGVEVARNLDPYGELARTPLNAALLGAEGLRFPFGLVLPFAALGAVALQREGARHHALRATLAFVGLNALGIALFLPAGRYRLALALALLPIAVRGATHLAEVARGRAELIPSALLGATLLGLFANLTPRFTGPDLSRDDLALRAEAHLNADQPELARATIERDFLAHRRARRDADRWVLLARACGASRDLRCADAALQRAITLEPRCYDAAGRLGALRLSQRNPRGAIDAFERSLRVVPMQPSTWIGVADAREMAGDAAGAARARSVASRLREQLARAP